MEFGLTEEVGEEIQTALGDFLIKFQPHNWSIKIQGTGGALHTWRCNNCGMEQYSSGFPWKDDPRCSMEIT